MTSQNKEDKPTKSVIVVIVEGISDQKSFEKYINKASKNKNIFFSVCRGDLLSDFNKDSEEYNDILIKKIKENASENHYDIEDILLVVQLTDTDGVFAPDDDVVEQDTKLQPDDNPIYSDKKVKVYDVSKMKKSREFKRERLNDCIKMNVIKFDLQKHIPYKIYYMSCNLECALHNIYNATDEEKDTLADTFSKKYDDTHFNDFLNFMKELNKSGTENFDESWNYIRQGLNSLLPSSNFVIFFSELMKNCK